MTANELRIGNWVLWGELMVKLGALGIMEFDVGAMKYEPIPLTPEILEKCEFKKDSGGTLVKDKCLYWLDNGILQIAIGYAPLFNAPGKYLHQLQNLYFALTGEELSVEL